MAWPEATDYNEAIQAPALCFADPDLRQGQPEVNALGWPLPCSGNFAAVYKVFGPDQTAWAVKCFTREVAGLRERYHAISAHLCQARLPFAVDFQYLQEGVRIRGDWYAVVKMRWVEGLTLNEFLKAHADRPPILERLAGMWLKLARELRRSGIAHADLQHGNVLLVPGGKSGVLSVRLIDYDGMFVPALANSRSGEVGHANYQHPERARQGVYDAEVDRFPHLVIYTALRALLAGGRPLWDRYDNGENLLFRQQDFADPVQSPLFRELWQLPDPAVRALTTHLARACQAPIAAVPLLSDLGEGGTRQEFAPVEAVRKPARTPLAAREGSGAAPPGPSAETPGGSVGFEAPVGPGSSSSFFAACPFCGGKFRVLAGMAGREVTCQICGRPFVLDGANAQAPADPLPPALSVEPLAASTHVVSEASRSTEVDLRRPDKPVPEPRAPAPAAPAVKACPICSARNVATAGKCQQCGERLTPASGPAAGVLVARRPHGSPGRGSSLPPVFPDGMDTNRLATASLALGGVALTISFIPFVRALSLLLGVLGLLLAAVTGRARWRRRAEGLGVPVAGALLNGLALLLAAWWLGAPAGKQQPHEAVAWDTEANLLAQQEAARKREAAEVQRREAEANRKSAQEEAERRARATLERQKEEAARQRQLEEDEAERQAAAARQRKLEEDEAERQAAAAHQRKLEEQAKRQAAAAALKRAQQEAEASRKLQQAIAFLDVSMEKESKEQFEEARTNLNIAIRRFREIVQSYPLTKAAETARKLLKEHAG